MKDHPIQCPEDYFNNFMGRLTGKDPDDLDFYERPPVAALSEFTMEDKLAFDKKEREFQATLSKWETMWGAK